MDLYRSWSEIKNRKKIEIIRLHAINFQFNFYLCTQCVKRYILIANQEALMPQETYFL